MIEDITYNPRGQRKRIKYGNQAVTQYTYDTDTFRLVRLLTTRNSGNDKLQDLNYTFDPVGNIVAMEDQAQQTHYFQNSVVSPDAKYEYDSLYRLLKATGREHYGQGQIGESDFPINTPVPFNNGSNSVETYTEQYEYDEIGNILKLIHQAGSGNWTRGYHYGTANNRLLKTSLPGDTVSDPGTYSASYTHDSHGNMTSMPHLSDMKWDFQDRLKEVDLGGGGTAWYVYNTEGNRVRKVIENGNLTKDRLYLDDINEYYREYLSGSKDLERETLHVMDDRKRLAMVETKTYENGSPVGTPSPVIRYNFDNHLGSSCLELDTSANIISYEEYHPFGTSSYRLGDSATEVSLKRYRYAGKERDEESGLYYYGARYYAAWLCRFVGVDPLKDKYPFYNTYQYAGNKPIGSIDLDGLESVNQVDEKEVGQQEQEGEEKATKESVDEEGNKPLEYYMNHQGFFIEGDSTFGEYVGNVKPTDDPYRELERIEGKLYHKNTSNLPAEIINYLSELVAEEDEGLIEKKPYDPAEESFNEGLLMVGEFYVGGLVIGKLGSVASKLLRGAGNSIWKLAPGSRGFAYEEILKANLRNIKGYKVIDDFIISTGRATSVKTIDLAAKTYNKAGKAVFSKLKGYIDDLAKFQGASRGGVDTIGKINSKVLELGIPKNASRAQIEQLNKAIKYAETKGIKLNIRVVK